VVVFGAYISNIRYDPTRANERPRGWVGGMTQVVGYLPRKHEGLNSNPQYCQKINKKKGKKKRKAQRLY
jgi:hypothetical protein